MPILATGRSSAGPFAAGFTLVEVLVVMLIISLLAGSIALTLPDERQATERQAVERWYRQVRWAAERSLWSGRVRAWEISSDGARIMLRSGEAWIADEEVQARRQPLPEGMRLQFIEMEGQRRPLPERIVFRAGDMPVFAVQLASSVARWQISGDPSGQIIWRRLDSAGGAGL
jgi:type II secretion system protein H